MKWLNLTDWLGFYNPRIINRVTLFMSNLVLNQWKFKFIFYLVGSMLGPRQLLKMPINPHLAFPCTCLHQRDWIYPMSGIALIAPIDAGIEKGQLSTGFSKDTIIICKGQTALNESRLNIQIKCLMVAQVIKECRFGNSSHCMCGLLALDTLTAASLIHSGLGIILTP